MVIEVVHEVVVVAGPAYHDVHQPRPWHGALREDEVVLGVRHKERPLRGKLLHASVLLGDGLGKSYDILVVVVHTTPNDEHLR